MYNGNVQQNPTRAASCHNESSHLSPVLAYDYLSRCKFSTPTSTPLYSSINKLYAQNPVFEIVREESVKVYLHVHNGNVHQNPICVESCVTKTPVFMVTKTCTKILIFSTRFSCQYFAAEDFVTLKKSCRWGNVMFGHGFDKLV